jgi:hypothetical protein
MLLITVQRVGVGVGVASWHIRRAAAVWVATTMDDETLDRIPFPHILDSTDPRQPAALVRRAAEQGSILLWALGGEPKFSSDWSDDSPISHHISLTTLQYTSSTPPWVL